MAATLLIPTALRAFTDGQGKLELDGETVEQLLQALVSRYPDLQPHLYDEAGALRAYINLFVNEQNIRTTGGLATPVAAGAEVFLVPAIAGGTGVRA